MTYDSTNDTVDHINKVRECLSQIVRNLLDRHRVHDASKLIDPEKSTFDEFTPKLSTLEYGTPEYEATRQEMLATGALEHHYKFNDHHPEHYDNGIRDMSLMAITEMLADWNAATSRMEKGDLRTSIHQNAVRFGYGEVITDILINTAEELGWL